MICPKCNETGVLNHANGHNFYYCRTCKDEIKLEDPAKEENKETEENPDVMVPYFWFDHPVPKNYDDER